MKFSESIPLLRDNTNSDNAKGVDLSGVIALTLVLLVVAVAAVWWRNRGKMQGIAGNDNAMLGGWSRWPFGKQRCSVNVLGMVHLTSKYSLHEVEWQGKRLLIGCSGQSIQLLSETSVVNPPVQDRGV